MILTFSFLVVIAYYAYKNHKNKEEEYDGNDYEKATPDSKFLTRNLLRQTLTDSGISFEEDDNCVYAEYQAATFRIIANDNSQYINVQLLFWYEISTNDTDKFSLMQKVVNGTNLHGSTTVYYSINSEKEIAYLHTGTCGLFIPAIPDIGDYLQSMFCSLFQTREFVYTELSKAFSSSHNHISQSGRTSPLHH